MGAIDQSPNPLASVRLPRPAIRLPHAGPDLPRALVAWAALSVALNVGLSRFTYGIVLPSLQRDVGLDYTSAGLMHAAHLGGYMIGTLASHRLGRRIGLRRAIRAAHWLVALGAALCAVTPAADPSGPWLLGLGRLTTGLGGGVAVVSVFTLVIGTVPAASRASVSAVLWGGVGGVVLLSAFAAPYLAHATTGEWRIVFWITAAVACGVAGTTPGGTGLAEPERRTSACGCRFGLRELLSTRWLFLNGTYFCFGLAYIGYATFVGSRLLETHRSSAMLVATWSVLGAAIIAGAAATALVLGAARPARYAVVGSTACGMVGAIVTFGDSAVGTIAGAALVGLSLASTPTVLNAHTQQRSSAQHYAAAFGTAFAALGLGQLIGPALTGHVADRIGTGAMPLVAGVLYACAALFGLLDSQLGHPGAEHLAVCPRDRSQRGCGQSGCGRDVVPA